MDEQPHRYELDESAILRGLEQVLSERGYSTVEHSPGKRWIFDTRWSHGAAYGEIGSLLYSLAAQNLRSVNDESC